MEKDKKVTALYCRLSKDDGSNSESLSIRTQKSMLMEYATRNGFGNCQYYVDDGYSGTNSDRPAFQELLDDIREGKVATVITKDQSRLGRNHIETGTYMEIFFPEHGVRYIAINDGYDSNEQSQMDIAPFRNIINEMYAKDTSRKIKSALRTRKKSGKYISSGAPFGYQKDPADHNHLVIDPNTAPVVEYIYSMAEEGLGLHRIAKRLHDEKVLKPCYYKKEMFGRFIDDEKMYDWDSAYISQVLHSPVYAGHIIYEAKPTVSMKSKKRRYIPFEERAIVPNTHEAIIPQDRWENVQRILYSRSAYYIYKSYGAALYREMLSILVDAWDGDSDSFLSGILHGMARFLALYQGEYSRERLILRLRTVHPKTIIRLAQNDTGNVADRHMKQILSIYNGAGRTHNLPCKR